MPRRLNATVTPPDFVFRQTGNGMIFKPLTPYAEKVTMGLLKTPRPEMFFLEPEESADFVDTMVEAGFRFKFDRALKQDQRMTNPWLAYGWVLPDGRYVPVVGEKDHPSIAASIMRIKNKAQAFRRALAKRWIRVGEATIQLPSPPDDSAFLRARDHVRETSPANEDWDIRIEWWAGKDVVSYKVPILEFMEMDGIGDLRRYPKAVW
jgi:hypothetical protein